MIKINIKKWLSQNSESLKGKTVAITGSTGGIGKPLSEMLAYLSANIVLVDRNFEKSYAFGTYLQEKYRVKIDYITADLSQIESVKRATEKLKKLKIDIFIHNAGAYYIPREITDTGYNNVFNINFISPYYIIRELLDTFRENTGRAVIVGSIAYNYSKIDKTDIDFSSRKSAAKIYGNAKRYLMFSLFELFKNETKATLSVTHPGITFTNITAHYPKLIFAVIKHPMKLIFIKPQCAALSIIRGVFQSTPYKKWFGPRFFGIWGKPKMSRIINCSDTESEEIFKHAERIYTEIKKKTPCA